jgi:hypothetical protein
VAGDQSIWASSPGQFFSCTPLGPGTASVHDTWAEQAKRILTLSSVLVVKRR